MLKPSVKNPSFNPPHFPPTPPALPLLSSFYGGPYRFEGSISRSVYR